MGNRAIYCFEHISTGGSSVHYHIMSEKSRELFARAIVMSGTALNRWALSEKNEDEDLFNMFKLGMPSAITFS